MSMRKMLLAADKFIYIITNLNIKTVSLNILGSYKYT